MWISPFVAGIAFTIMVEFALLMIVALIDVMRKRRKQ